MIDEYRSIDDSSIIEKLMLVFFPILCDYITVIKKELRTNSKVGPESIGP